MKNRTKRVIGYVRVSTQAQAIDGLSLVAQRVRIEEYCQQQGWELSNVYHDAGISGKKANNRPGLQRALTCLRTGLADALVILRLDRLSRSLSDFAKILNEAEGKWDLVSLTENFRTDTPSGRLIFHVLASICQFEREIIGQRTPEGMAVLKHQNRLRGSVPYGFRLLPDGKTLEPSPEEMVVVEKIVALRKKKGTGFATISKILNVTGYPARGKKWYPQSVYNVWKANNAIA